MLTCKPLPSNKQPQAGFYGAYKVFYAAYKVFMMDNPIQPIRSLYLLQVGSKQWDALTHATKIIQQEGRC